MNYYVLQVVTGKENQIITELPNLNLINPQRKIIIRKQGKQSKEIKPIFQGYLFLKTDKVEKELHILKSNKHIIKILNNFSDPTPLQKYDLELLKPIFNPNFKPEISNIKFDQNDKIVVTNGPLKDFEGKIIKVDKRKQRATVQIEMYNKIFKINFSYVDISK